MRRGIIDETEDWLPIGGLEPGFDENKPPRTEELVGKELTFLFEVDRLWDGEVVDYHMAVDGLLECEEDS